MKLSTTTRYAIYIMTDLARQGQTPLREICERQQISYKYGEQVITALRAAGLVKSIRGTHGGYLLAHPAEEIALGDVVRAVDNPYTPSQDPRDAGTEEAFQQALTAFWRELDAVLLATLVE